MLPQLSRRGESLLSKLCCWLNNRKKVTLIRFELFHLFGWQLLPRWNMVDANKHFRFDVNSRGRTYEHFRPRCLGLWVLLQSSVPASGTSIGSVNLRLSSNQLDHKYGARECSDSCIVIYGWRISIIAITL